MVQRVSSFFQARSWVNLIGLCGLTFAMLYGSARAERVRVYSEPSYQGWNQIFLGPQPHVAGQLEGHKILSAHVISGSWLLCSDAFYAGDCAWISRDVGDLSELGFNKIINSLRPERVEISRYRWGGRPPPSHRSLVFFAQANYTGKWVAVSDSAPDLFALHVKVKPQSIVVQTGIWRMCTLPDYRGRCLTVTGDVWNLPAIFSGEIASVKRIR